VRIVDPVLGDTQLVEVELENGRAQARAVGRASMTVDVGALGAMYTGWLLPRVAVRLGRLEGATRGDVELLEAAFAGPRPWILETF
jgi:predicted acetyltransferase